MIVGMSVSPTDDISQAIELQTAGNVSELADRFLRSVAHLGVEYVVAGLCPTTNWDGYQPRTNVLLARSPTAWGKRYFDAGYVFHDPVIATIRSGTVAFAWSEIATGEQGADILLEAAAHGIRTGYTISLSQGERKAALSMTGCRVSVPQQEVGRVQMLATLTLGRALALRAHATDIPALTARETEAFALARIGLTKTEIADRMRISSHGADKHLRSIRRKLGVHLMIEAAGITPF